MKRKIAFLRRDTYVAHQLLKDLKTRMKDSNVSLKITDNQDEDEFESVLPYQTTEEFLGLENFLQDDKNKTTVVSKFCSIKHSIYCIFIKIVDQRNLTQFG